MKKAILFCITGLLTLSLTSCSIIAKHANTITQTQLTEREKSLLSLSDSNYFVFDYSVDNSYNWVTVWEEQYESGKKTSGFEVSEKIKPNSEGMIIATMNQYSDKKVYDWTIGVVNNGGSTSTAQIKETCKNTVSRQLTAFNSLKQIPISTTAIGLAFIGYNNSPISSPPTDSFFENPDKNLKQISNDQLVYLIKCKFSKTKGF